eukprot:scaffold2042_cov19-Tisochrysis_lutea.AAC.2
MLIGLAGDGHRHPGHAVQGRGVREQRCRPGPIGQAPVPTGEDRSKTPPVQLVDCWPVHAKKESLGFRSPEFPVAATPVTACWPATYSH